MRKVVDHSLVDYALEALGHYDTGDDRLVMLTAQPGQVKTVVDMDIPRPRDLTRLRKHARFNELYDVVWHDLRPRRLNFGRGTDSNG